jgi:hypothetical protein
MEATVTGAWVVFAQPTSSNTTASAQAATADKTRFEFMLKE